MGAAKDIVEWAGVPRFLFSDFPLGNSAGKPHEPDTQRFTLDLALKVLESAIGPRTTVQSPLRWNDDGDWKNDYNNLARMPAEEVARRRAEFDKIKQTALEQRKKAGVALVGRSVAPSERSEVEGLFVFNKDAPLRRVRAASVGDDGR